MLTGLRGTCFAVLLLAASLPARAEWLPHWMGVWEGEMGSPVDLRVAADGAVWANLHVSRLRASAFTSIVRFEPDGSFGWVYEYETSPLGMLALADGRVALAGIRETMTARVLDGSTGVLLHTCEWDDAEARYDSTELTHALAQASDGTLFMRAHVRDGNEVIVLRCSAEGQVLPQWRGAPGGNYARADDIIAMPDGGAVVAGRGDGGEGYFVMRFDAAGEVLFVDNELGETGWPLGWAHVEVDAAGALLVATSPESTRGLAYVLAWKLDADGQRVWTRSFDPPEVTNFELEAVALAPDGDLVLAAKPSIEAPRVIRIDGSDGSVQWNTPSPVPMRPTGIAATVDGRVLVGGYEDVPGGSGHVTSRFVEFAGNGQPCRQRIDLGMSAWLRVAASAHGWSVLGLGNGSIGGVAGSTVHRYEADSPCDLSTDAIFVDGFDAALPRPR